MFLHIILNEPPEKMILVNQFLKGNTCYIKKRQTTKSCTQLSYANSNVKKHILNIAI